MQMVLHVTSNQVRSAAHKSFEAEMRELAWLKVVILCLHASWACLCIRANMNIDMLIFLCRNETG